MALILQLETSTEVCSVALSKNGQLIHCYETSDSNSHTEKLTLLISKCMNDAGHKISQIDAVAVSDGPGSYTSLRIGVATSKGICYATGCPLIIVNSLNTLANGITKDKIHPNDIIVPMIDARRMEVYMAVFDDTFNIIDPTKAVILDSDSFSLFAGTKNRIHLCGNGAQKWWDIYATDQFSIHHTTTSAKYMTADAYNAYLEKRFTDMIDYTPNYFKSPNITKSLKKIL
jgi:tRNA threonylcarbamoyladenosine biosynthesis protein TsaB